MPQICFRAPCPENPVMGNGQVYDLSVSHNFLLDTASEIL